MCGAIRYFPDWIYFSTRRRPTFLCSELDGHTLVWSVSCYHLLERSKCIPQDAWIMVISLNKLCLHCRSFWKGSYLLLNLVRMEVMKQQWHPEHTQTNSLLQLLCTYQSTINHTLKNLWQFYILEMIKF